MLIGDASGCFNLFLREPTVRQGGIDRSGMYTPTQEEAHWLPRWASLLLSPPVVAVLTGVFFAFPSEDTPDPGSWFGFAVFCVATAILPTAYVVRLRQRGRISGVFVPEGRERTRPLLVTASSCLAGCAILALAPTGRGIVILQLWYGLFGLLAAAIAGRRHMSLHAAGSWGPIVCLGYCCGAYAWVLVPVALLVTWARYTLGVHSVAQLVAGALVGATSALATFAIADLLIQLF